MPIAMHGTRTEMLARLPLLAGLEPDILQELAAQCDESTFSEGELISLEGDPCPAILLIAEGIVQLRQLSQEGREYILAYLSQGDCIHLAEALEERAGLATAQALTPVVLYAIETAYFVQMMHERPALASAVARYLAGEVGRLTAMVRDLALHSVRTRLARFLLAHAESPLHAQARGAQHTWTQEAIAASIGTVRDVVGRMLRAFVDEGLIRRERARLVVLDRTRLEREAQSGTAD